MSTANMSFNFESKNIADEVAPFLIDLLKKFNECGDLYNHVTTENATITTSGNPVIDSNPDVAVMFDETFMIFLAEVLCHYYPDYKFSATLHIDHPEYGVYDTHVNALNGKFASVSLGGNDDEPEALYCIADEHNFEDEEWEPLTYEDADEFTFDYYYLYKGEDLSFFKDAPLSSYLSSVNRDELEEEYEDFENGINTPRSIDIDKI